MAPKRKDDFSEEFTDEEEEQPKPKKKRASGGGKKKKDPTEPFVDARGWHVEPPSLIWKTFGDPEGSSKIAGFDLDSTLVNRKSDGIFAKNETDWKWWNSKVPKQLAELVEDGYKLVIFSNQGGIKGALTGKMKDKVTGMIDLIHKDLEKKAKVDVPLQAFIAPSMEPGDACRKPGVGMWDYMVKHCNDGIDPDLVDCFFVGDADGSHGTHGDSDKAFAEALGIRFDLPEDYFGPFDGKGKLDEEALAEAKLSLESGTNPNAELLAQMQQLAEDTQATTKYANDPKSAVFKAKALDKAAIALASFDAKITAANVKELQKLPGVGKGTIEKIKCYLKSGNISEPEDQEAMARMLALLESGGGSAKKADLTKERQEALAFL